MEDNNTKVDLEEGAGLELDFAKVAGAVAECPDIIPVVVQDSESKEEEPAAATQCR